MLRRGLKKRTKKWVLKCFRNKSADLFGVPIPVVEKDGKYYLRAGKRRLIAAKKADLKKVSVKVEE